MLAKGRGRPDGTQEREPRFCPTQSQGVSPTVTAAECALDEPRAPDDRAPDGWQLNL
jgi:hypothetical protein